MTNEIIIYQADGLTKVEVKVDDETVWLNRQQIASLFNRDVKTIGKHINNVFSEGELDKKLVVAKFATTTQHGAIKGKTQTLNVDYYNLDVIISVGYRVKSKQGVFFDGQIFDSHKLVSDIIRSAEKSIVLIDNYVDDTVLTLFSKKDKKVNCAIFTKTISKQLKLDAEKFNKQYPTLNLKQFNKAHDRFLIIDENEVYHNGASLKDLGKKWFAFSKLDKDSVTIIDSIKELL